MIRAASRTILREVLESCSSWVFPQVAVPFMWPIIVAAACKAPLQMVADRITMSPVARLLIHAASRATIV
jgi:hypothetical protein